MKCQLDHRNITPGQQADKRIECWRLPDGTELLFGPLMQAGHDAVPEGSVLLWARHNKCHYVAVKRENRGDDAALGSDLAMEALYGDDEDE